MLCEILEDFKGSQDGLVVTQFLRGETVELTDYLMGCIDKKWVQQLASQEARTSPIEIENKAIVTDGSHKKGKK